MPRTLFKDYGNRQTQKPQEEVQQTMKEVTETYLNDMEHDSVFFQKNALRPLACFLPSEVEVNKRIGMGEFGVVLEVTDIRLQDPTSHDGMQTLRHVTMVNSKSCGHLPLYGGDREAETSETAAMGSLENEPLRQHLAHKVIRECDAEVHPRAKRRQQQPDCESTFWRPRFAVKQIRKDLYPNKKIEAGKDLAREAKLLSRLEHPNIIRLRATVGTPGEEDFMLLLDRLGTSLSEQVMQWQQRHHEISGTGSFVSAVLPWNLPASSQQKQLERTILSERLLALYDVARAMQFLNQKSILFRDLKTENVARNHHGAFQLLDFGLAKELKEKDRVTVHMVDTNAAWSEDSSSTADTPTHSLAPSNSVEDLENTYKLTGLTGTLRIMSPEVLQCQPYGLAADVYSYGIMLWEVFQGERNRLNAPEVIKGKRPELPVVGMPPRIESLIKKCYGSPAFRPTFAMLSQELEYQILELQQKAWQVETEARFGQHSKRDTDDFQHICLDHHVNIFQRFEYLRELSVQSLAMATNTTSATPVAAVEN